LNIKNNTNSKIVKPKSLDGDICQKFDEISSKGVFLLKVMVMI